MNTRLIVFAKLPVAGRVKTRLAATIGEAAALATHRRLLALTLDLARTAGSRRREWRYDDCGFPVDPASAHCLRALQEEGWLVAPQHGPDLGARMHEALGAALAAGERPVLVGSDCPVLGPGDLASAFAALDEADAVVSPTEDGGYALVGVSRPLPSVFEGVAWGTATVLATTRARLAAAGARHVELRTVWDVDVEADLDRWNRLAGAAGH